jgi:nitroreductase
MDRHRQLITAVEHALRAPSVHNTQPWRWRITADTVELHADWNRHLVATDPERRDLVLSCGAALHHLLVTLAAQDLPVDVERMPDPENPGHLATVAVDSTAAGQPADATLFRSIGKRRTDRRRMSHRPVPEDLLSTLARQIEPAGARLLPVTSQAMRERLNGALLAGAHRQEFSAGYATELELWTRRYTAARDGIPSTNITPVPAGPLGDTALRRFPHGRLRQPRQRTGEGTAGDAALLVVVATSDDEVVDRLRAGEASSAVLLEATRLGLATTPLSQGIEIDATRRAIQQDVLRVPEHPQLLIRIGWPASTAAELPATPRRDLHSVLLPS